MAFHKRSCMFSSLVFPPSAGTCSDVADGFLDKLEKHLHLVYTGRTRLAKNLLQVRTLCSVVYVRRVLSYPAPVGWIVLVFKSRHAHMLLYVHVPFYSVCLCM